MGENAKRERHLSFVRNRSVGKYTAAAATLITTTSISIFGKDIYVNDKTTKNYCNSFSMTLGIDYSPSLVDERVFLSSQRPTSFVQRLGMISHTSVDPREGLKF